MFKYLESPCLSPCTNIKKKSKNTQHFIMSRESLHLKNVLKNSLETQSPFVSPQIRTWPFYIETFGYSLCCMIVYTNYRKNTTSKEQFNASNKSSSHFFFKYFFKFC